MVSIERFQLAQMPWEMTVKKDEMTLIWLRIDPDWHS